MKIEILIATPEDLKKFILENELTKNQISDLTMHTIRCMFLFETKEDLFKQIDEVLIKHPNKKTRPMFGELSLNN